MEAPGGAADADARDTGLAVRPTRRAAPGDARVRPGSAAAFLVHRPALAGIACSVLVGVLPHQWAGIGVLAPLLVAAGYTVFWALHRHSAKAAHAAASALLPALVVHSLLDGAALGLLFGGPVSEAERWPVALALIVHRLPEGVFVRAMIGPRFGARGVFAVLGTLATATVAGAALSGSAVARLDERVVHAVLAFGLGMLLREVGHRHSGPLAARVRP